MKHKEKYSWYFNREKEISYTVIHTESDGIETLIAITDTSEKAHFISKALNQFDFEKYEHVHQ